MELDLDGDVVGDGDGSVVGVVEVEMVDEDKVAVFWHDSRLRRDKHEITKLNE